MLETYLVVCLLWYLQIIHYCESSANVIIIMMSISSLVCCRDRARVAQCTNRTSNRKSHIYILYTYIKIMNKITQVHTIMKKSRPTIIIIVGVITFSYKSFVILSCLLCMYGLSQHQQYNVAFVTCMRFTVRAFCCSLELHYLILF